MKLILKDLPEWLRCAILAQVVVSLLAIAIVLLNDEPQSIGYSLSIGLVPIGLLVAYLLHLPYASLLLRTFSAATAVLGGLVIVVIYFSGSLSSGFTLSRVILGGQVAAAILMLYALSRVKAEKENWGRD